MLSINIPVFNFEVFELVAALHGQAAKLGIDFEIRVYDDGSEETFKLKNRNISGLGNVIYAELPENLGRAAIRNKMGLESEYEYLLFIDADSKIIQHDYLEKFLKNALPNRVLCGGTSYSPDKPADPEKWLRWHYGTSREAISAEARKRKKGFIITSNNFLITRNVFGKLHFREEIKKYGHEDTLLGFDLHRAGFEIFHINNPVEHTGLEDSAIFINKTKTALHSLFSISRELLPGNADFQQQVYFMKRYNSIKKIIPGFVLRLFYTLCSTSIEKNLKGKNPSLFLFDLYKLAYFATLEK